MTLHALLGKLRKRNKGDYRQFQFCIAFAVMLISSFLILICSPLIQEALPDGGDSGKLTWLIFGVAAIGCIVFVLYVTKLFLRYKSRELGIFMALGTEKHILKNALTAELAKMTAIYSAAGILLGAVISLAAGNVIEIILSDISGGQFSFTLSGFLFSVCYAAVLFLIIQFLAGRAMKRTDVMEVINEQRRQEPMKKSVSGFYLTSGVLLAALGIFGGLFLSKIVVYTTGILLGGWTNIFYLLAVAGIYRLLVYAISSHKRGRNPQKYYNNLIDYGMMKFQGASVVRNMLVITLLLFGGMYAISYLPTNLASTSSDQGYEADFSFRYLNDADEPSEAEINALAEKHGIMVTDYKETGFLRVFGSGTERDYNDDNKLIEEYYDKYALYDVISASDFEALTGISLDIPQGGYYQMINSSSYENIWFSYGDMDKLFIENENTYLPLRYIDTVSYEALVTRSNHGMGDSARFVVNNADYARLKNGLPAERLATQVLFNADRDMENKIAFSNEFFKEFANRRSAGMDVLEYYNAAAAEREGDDYIRDFTGASVNPENPLEETDWQFAPLIVPLTDQQTIMFLAVRLLMFSYIFIICIAAAGVIGYTRSQSVGLSNRQVFEDIKRLGANRRYRSILMKRQVRKVFVLPTLIGILLCLLYQILVQWNNDGRFTSSEARSTVILAAIGLCIGVFQYVIYRFSLRKTGRLLNL